MSGDYTQAGLRFRLSKVARYVGMYGISRTWVKVRGQYHMKATGRLEGPRWVNPACRDPTSAIRNVAIIGCGNYAFSNIAYYVAKENRRFLRAAYDVRPDRAISLCKAYRGSYVPSDWQEILNDRQVEVVFIASNHATHAEYAEACIRAGKHVHIEKPHVVTQSQLDSLTMAMRLHPESQVFLGFNRPRSRLFKELQAILSRETGPVMINWFIAGHEIADDHWYFDEKEGGRVLGNLSHWTDLTLHLVGLEKAFPCTIIPATPPGAKSDFVVSIMFADRSCASITFSAKGHTFDGVREVLNAHKGNVLANLSDFHSLTTDIVDKRTVHKLRHRDHGHRANIVHSLAGSAAGKGGETEFYVTATAKFFLAIRDAIDTGERVILS